MFELKSYPYKHTVLIPICIYAQPIVHSIVMVTFLEVRELVLAVALIGGFIGATFVFQDEPSFPVDEFLATPTPSRDPRVLEVSTPVTVVANPVVHIDIPEHNIFE